MCVHRCMSISVLLRRQLLLPTPRSPQGKIKREAVDQRMVRALADMPAELAEEAVSRYARSVDEHVRNPQGFMVRATARCSLL